MICDYQEKKEKQIREKKLAKVREMYGDDPLCELYIYAFDAMDQHPCIKDAVDKDDRNLRRAVVYETLDVVRRWFNQSKLN